MGALQVILHCSDGWDRTAQLCCLAELCLDPFYRVRGWRTLVMRFALPFLVCSLPFHCLNAVRDPQLCTAFLGVFTAFSLPFLVRSLPLHCLSWCVHCLFTSFPGAFAAFLLFTNAARRSKQTIEGLRSLIKKEWLEFGHKFRDRVWGPVVGEQSPIFVQFLDSVHQLIRAHPAAFEFNEHLLLYLVDVVHSNQFSDFRHNCAAERHRSAAAWSR